MKIYAGIGSRQTPPDVLELMHATAARLAHQGWLLRSGGAVGADKAFEAGARTGDGDLEVFRPEDATPEAVSLASKYHPAWHRCSGYARKLHGRNCQILLGRDLDVPAQMVLCWTPGAALSGGTAQGIRIALDKGIKVFNLANLEVYKRLEAFVC